MSDRQPPRPIDTRAGRILVVVVAPLMAIGAIAMKMDHDGIGPWWAVGVFGLGILIACVFMAFWNRGYFGHSHDHVE